MLIFSNQLTQLKQSLDKNIIDISEAKKIVEEVNTNVEVINYNKIRTLNEDRFNHSFEYTWLIKFDYFMILQKRISINNSCLDSGCISTVKFNFPFIAAISINLNTNKPHEAKIYFNIDGDIIKKYKGVKNNAFAFGLGYTNVHNAFTLAVVDKITFYNRGDKNNFVKWSLLIQPLKKLG